MNKKYQTPKMDVLMFEVEDIVTASTPAEDGFDPSTGEVNKSPDSNWFTSYTLH